MLTKHPAAVLLACLLAATGCGSTADKPAKADSAKPSPTATETPKMTVAGTITLNDADGIVLLGDEDYSTDCDGTGGYDDVSAGAQVVIKNADGTTIGLATLGTGHSGSVYDGVTDECTFSFATDDVPAESGDIMTIKIANRPDYSFKREDAGSLKLSLG